MVGHQRPRMDGLGHSRLPDARYCLRKVRAQHEVRFVGAVAAIARKPTLSKLCVQHRSLGFVALAMGNAAQGWHQQATCDGIVAVLDRRGLCACDLGMACGSGARYDS